MTDTHLEIRPMYGRREFEQEIVAFMPQLRAFARSLTGTPDMADDLAQDTLAKAILAWKSYESGTNMKAWLFMIMRNQFLTGKRRSWRATQLDQETAERTIIDPSKDPEEQMGFAQEFSQFAGFLAMIPTEQADAVIIVKYLELSYIDAGHVLGCAVGTVKSRVSRGLDMLKDLSRTHPEGCVIDLSAWSVASKNLDRRDPQFLIAKAYEEIYAFWLLHSQDVPAAAQSVELTPEEKAWREFLDSDSDLEDDFDSLVRGDCT